MATTKEVSREKDDEDGENQGDTVVDDDALGDSFDHSGGQRASKSKNKENQSYQSGTGIRFESDSVFVAEAEILDPIYTVYIVLRIRRMIFSCCGSPLLFPFHHESLETASPTTI